MRGLAPFVVLVLVASAFSGCLDSFKFNKTTSGVISLDLSGWVRAGNEFAFRAVGSGGAAAGALTVSRTFGDGNPGQSLAISQA